MAAEEKDSFSEEDVNTIFRIMHTIKGSSAMMEYSSLMTIAHRAEDLFAIVRDKSMEIVPEALRPALFDLLFQIIDFFRGEIERIENGQLHHRRSTVFQKAVSFIQQIAKWRRRCAGRGSAGRAGGAGPGGFRSGSRPRLPLCSPDLL